MEQPTKSSAARQAVFDAFAQIVKQGYRGHERGSEQFFPTLNAALDKFAAALAAPRDEAGRGEPEAKWAHAEAVTLLKEYGKTFAELGDVEWAAHIEVVVAALRSAPTQPRDWRTDEKVKAARERFNEVARREENFYIADVQDEMDALCDAVASCAAPTPSLDQIAQAYADGCADTLSAADPEAMTLDTNRQLVERATDAYAKKVYHDRTGFWTAAEHYAKSPETYFAAPPTTGGMDP